MCVVSFFFFKQKTAYEMLRSLVGSEMCIRDRSTDDIKAALREKKPVIVLVDLGFWVITRPHYLVIIGYSDKGFIAHTGYESGETFPYAEFGRIWAKKGSVYLSVWR